MDEKMRALRFLDASRDTCLESSRWNNNRTPNRFLDAHMDYYPRPHTATLETPDPQIIALGPRNKTGYKHLSSPHHFSSLLTVPVPAPIPTPGVLPLCPSRLLFLGA